MSPGYSRPLYLLPFDHRHSYVSDMFHFASPLDAAQQAAVTDSKQVIYEGFQAAVARGIPKDRAGILVDEEFGADILRDANRKGFVTALSTEQSGSDELEFDYGAAFAQHIEAFSPTFAKVLIRYNPEGDAPMNQRQRARLKSLSDYCRARAQLMMLELLVPPTPGQLDRVRGDKPRYDAEVRPALMLATIEALQDAEVEPDVWKIEGLDRREDCERIVVAAQRQGRTAVGCIVLGRGADEAKVAAWLGTAASVPGFIGFAVGRTTFWDPVCDLVAGRVTRDEAVARIAARFGEWTAIFEKNRSPNRGGGA